MGRYDLYVLLAERYHWTPEEVGRLDPDFVEELIAKLEAEAGVAQTESQRARKHGSRGVVDADLSEIG